MNEQEQSNLDTDYEVILRCQKGDVEAFEEIVKKFQKKMFNIPVPRDKEVKLKYKVRMRF